MDRVSGRGGACEEGAGDGMREVGHATVPVLMDAMSGSAVSAVSLWMCVGWCGGGGGDVGWSEKQPLEDRKQEGGRLSRTSDSLSDDILALDCKRYRLGLDRRGLFKASGRNSS